MTDPLTEIRAAMEKATKGPWEECGIYGIDSVPYAEAIERDPDGTTTICDRLIDVHPDCNHDECDRWEADRALIVLLRNHASALVAVAEAAREAMPEIERTMRKRYDEYVGEDVIGYLREHGKLVLDDSGKERPLIVAWKALDAALAALRGGK